MLLICTFKGSTSIFHFYLFSGSKAVESTFALLTETFKHIIDKSGSSTFDQLVSQLHDPSSDEPCRDQGYMELYCKLKEIKDLLRSHLIELQRASRSGWSTPEAKHRRAALLIWLTIQKVNVSTEQMTKLSDDVLGLIYDLLKSNDDVNVKHFKDLVSFIPSLKSNQLRYSGHYCSKMQASKRPSGCIFSEMVKSLYSYAKFLSNAGTNVKYVQTRYDLQKKLHMAKLNSINDDITSSTLEIKQSLHEFSTQLQTFIAENLATRFDALEKYFKALADFDRRKNQADVGYIKGKLKDFDKDIKSKEDKVAEKIRILVICSVSSATAELAQRTVELAQQIAAASNPFSWLTGGSDLNDVADRANAVAIAVVNEIRAVRVKIAFDKLAKRVDKLMKDFAKNAKYIKAVRTAIDKFDGYLNKNKQVDQNQLSEYVDEFLEAYNNYSPAVNKDSMDKYGALLEKFADESCDMIYAGGTLASSAVQDHVARKDYCLTINADIQSLMTSYNELYDFQFDMMETLAQVVKAHVAYVSAEQLSTQFEKPNIDDYKREKLALSQMSLNLLLVSRIHKIQLVRQFCNYVEYLNAGNQVVECKEALESLSDTSIDNLIALKLPRCSSTNVEEKMVSIPTQPSKDGDQAYIALDDLYSGRETYFKIPDSQWLLSNGWLFPGDEFGRVYYLEDMKIYLPDVSDASRSIRVEMTTSGSARLLPEINSTHYHLSDSETKIRYQYEDLFYRCSSGKVIPSPYDYCKNQDMSLCTISETKKKVISPSIFSPWKIKAEIFNKRDNSVYRRKIFATPVKVMADIKLCVMQTSDSYFGAPSLELTTGLKDRCCVQSVMNGNGTYWDEQKERCEPCPDGSRQAASGYYCYET